MALIRDKDGTALVMTTASRLERAQEVCAIAVALVQVARALAEPSERRSPAAYGDFAWLSVLPEDAQRRFLGETTDRLLITASGGRVDDLEELVGDWLATAEAWSNPATRDALVADEVSPLRDVELVPDRPWTLRPASARPARVGRRGAGGTLRLSRQWAAPRWRGVGRA
jgi:hypothetical protein